MSDLPPDWKLYAAVVFHAFVSRGQNSNSENTRSSAIEAGIEMARAIEKKEDEE